MLTDRWTGNLRGYFCKSGHKAFTFEATPPQRLVNAQGKMISQQDEKLNVLAGIFQFFSFVPFVQHENTDIDQRKRCSWSPVRAWRRPPIGFICLHGMLHSAPSPLCSNTFGTMLIKMIVLKPREILSLNINLQHAYRFCRTSAIHCRLTWNLQT